MLTQTLQSEGSTLVLHTLFSTRPFPVRMSPSLGKRMGLPVTQGILASRSHNPLVSRPLLEAALLWQDQTLPLSILLDSGADESFIDRKLVCQLQIDTAPLDLPIETQALDGKRLTRVERHTIPVKLLVDRLKTHNPWLTHNPQIDWGKG